MARRPAHDLLPEDELLAPIDPVPGLPVEAQVEHMRELRRLHNDIARAHIERDERMFSLTVSGALSRRDMAQATGQSVARIGQIVRERSDAQRAGWAARGAAINARHMLAIEDLNRATAARPPAGELAPAYERWRVRQRGRGEAIALEQGRIELADGQLQLIAPHRLGSDTAQLQRLASGLRQLRSSYGVDGVDVLEVTPNGIRLGLNHAADGHDDVDAFIDTLVRALDRLSDDLST